MDKNLMCFVAVEFPDDPNVKGRGYWYLLGKCRDAEAGDTVIAPLGTHNREQTGVIRKVVFADENSAPYPVKYIKNIRTLLKNKPL